MVLLDDEELDEVAGCSLLVTYEFPLSAELGLSKLLAFETESESGLLPSLLAVRPFILFEGDVVKPTIIIVAIELT